MSKIKDIIRCINYVVFSNISVTAVGHGYYFRLNSICQGNRAICWLFVVGVKKTNCNIMIKDSIHQMLQYAARQLGKYNTDKLFSLQTVKD